MDCGTWISNPGNTASCKDPLSLLLVNAVNVEAGRCQEWPGGKLVRTSEDAVTVK